MLADAILGKKKFPTSPLAKPGAPTGIAPTPLAPPAGGGALATLTAPAPPALAGSSTSTSPTPLAPPSDRAHGYSPTMSDIAGWAVMNAHGENQRNGVPNPVEPFNPAHTQGVHANVENWRQEKKRELLGGGIAARSMSSPDRMEPMPGPLGPTPSFKPNDTMHQLPGGSIPHSLGGHPVSAAPGAMGAGLAMPSPARSFPPPLQPERTIHSVINGTYDNSVKPGRPDQSPMPTMAGSIMPSNLQRAPMMPPVNMPAGISGHIPRPMGIAEPEDRGQIQAQPTPTAMQPMPPGYDPGFGKALLGSQPVPRPDSIKGSPMPFPTSKPAPTGDGYETPDPGPVEYDPFGTRIPPVAPTAAPSLSNAISPQSRAIPGGKEGIGSVIDTQPAAPWWQDQNKQTGEPTFIEGGARQGQYDANIGLDRAILGHRMSTSYTDYGNRNGGTPTVGIGSGIAPANVAAEQARKQEIEGVFDSNRQQREDYNARKDAEAEQWMANILDGSSANDIQKTGEYGNLNSPAEELRNAQQKLALQAVNGTISKRDAYLQSRDLQHKADMAAWQSKRAAENPDLQAKKEAVRAKEADRIAKSKQMRMEIAQQQNRFMSGMPKDGMEAAQFLIANGDPRGASLMASIVGDQEATKQAKMHADANNLVLKDRMQQEAEKAGAMANMSKMQTLSGLISDPGLDPATKQQLRNQLIGMLNAPGAQQQQPGLGNLIAGAQQQPMPIGQGGAAQGGGVVPQGQPVGTPIDQAQFQRQEHEKDPVLQGVFGDLGQMDPGSIGRQLANLTGNPNTIPDETTLEKMASYMQARARTDNTFRADTPYYGKPWVDAMLSAPPGKRREALLAAMQKVRQSSASPADVGQAMNSVL